MILRTTHGIREALALTPVIREYKLRFPDQRIIVETDFPEVFENNPFVDKLTDFSAGLDVINLDMHSAVLSNTHFIDLFARVVLGDTRITKRAYEIFLTEEEQAKADNVVTGMGDNIAAIALDDEHTDKELLEEVVEQIGGWGYETVFLDELELPLRVNLAVTNKCVLFVGLDNDISYVAMCSQTPMVMGFTWRSPERIRPFRRGAPFIPVVAPESRCNLVKHCEKENGRHEFGLCYGMRCPKEHKFVCGQHNLTCFTDAVAEATME